MKSTQSSNTGDRFIASYAAQRTGRMNSMEETTSLAAAEYERSHIESEVRKSGADVDSRLEKRGSPYRLVFTKTLGSYERAAK